jgi:hypothetical protein
MRKVSRGFISVLMAMILVGCAGGDGSTVKGESSSGTASPSETTVTWNLVAIGDSNVSGSGIKIEEPYSPDAAFPGVYAQLLGAEQGVPVVRRSYFPDPLNDELRTVAQWNDVLASDQELRSDLGRANVVVVLVGYHNVIPALLFGDCGSQWEQLKKCLLQETRTMPADYDKLFSTIQGLVPPGASVLAGDYGIPTPLFDKWANKPFWPEMKKVMYEDWRNALETAAKANGVRVVHTYAALNGPKGDQPVPEDLTTDGWHFSAEGHELLAHLFMQQDGLSAP